MANAKTTSRVSQSKPGEGPVKVSDGLAQVIQERLIQWYLIVRRDLPWRERGDAYGIWVSEIMLQQTQVDTVRPYYERFMGRFPTVKDLAEAPEQDVLKLWAGLGYYARARNLQKGAKVVVSDFGGELPPSVPELRKIPGIGPYTAGAVASIAYDQPAAIVDGNVARVLSRLFRLPLDIKSTAGKKALWLLAERLVSQKEPSNFNQGLMELGALLCRPSSPNCKECPLQGICEAFSAEEVAKYPVVVKKAPKAKARVLALILKSGDRYLLGKRPSKGLLGGMWEFPMFPEQEISLLEGEAKVKKLRQVSRTPWQRVDAQLLLREATLLRCSVEPQEFEHLEAVFHIFTHLDLEVRPFRAHTSSQQVSLRHLEQVGGPIANYEQQKWLSLSQMETLPMGKIMVLLMKNLRTEKGEQLRMFEA